MHFLIFTGGNIDKDIALALLKHGNNKYIIAVDKGLSFLHEIGRTPDLIMGDFDSVSAEVLAHYQKGSAKIINFPKNKDATDTQLAVEESIERGASRITIVGATGSRLDHTMSNIYILGIPSRFQIPCEIIDAHNKISLLDKSTELIKDTQFGNYISFLPYTEIVEGLTLQGFLYPLNDFTLNRETSIAISNEISDERGLISFTKGILVMLQTKD